MEERTVVLFIAPTVDGYIASEDDSLEWLFEVEGEGDNGTSEFYETVDTILFGKRTYDWILEHDSKDFPYKDKKCYVFSRSAHPDTEDVTFVNEDVKEFVEKLKAQDGQKIWLMGGGELIHDFLEKNLIDEFFITIAPALIGRGIPLFKEGDYDIRLKLEGVRTFNQFVELHYTSKKA